jgi:hypothetical protein
MDALAKETAFAVKAPPAFARATLEAMDKQLSKPEGSFTPTTADALDSHLQAQLGDKADATLQAALATFELMPPDGQTWLQDDIGHNIDLKNITAEKTSAAVTHDIRVVIKGGVTKQQAHLALLAITNALIGDRVVLD